MKRSLVMRTTTRLLASCGLALAAAAPSVGAQSLAQRISAVSDGTVQFHFASRPGVCGDGRSFISLGHSLFMGSSTMRLGDAEWRQACVSGPVRVVLSVYDHTVNQIRTYVGELPPHQPDVTELGVASTRDATEYLLSLAEHLDGSTSERAILPAVLADSAVVWPRLLAIARDSDTRPGVTRQTAAFWLGRFAAAAMSGRSIGTLDEQADAAADTDDVRDAAVFGLSQLKHHAGVPPLIQVAESNKSTRVRERAIFWLSQSDDPRALEFFESVLRK